MNRHAVSPLCRIPFILAVLAFAGVGRGETILNSPHDMSATGPGPVKAIQETQVCIFCHTPHGATSEAPLWNRYDSGATFTPYSSSTAKASPGHPTGASKLCLSCHDGTVALGMVRSRTGLIAFQGGVHNMPPGGGLIGTDLSDDHPISFRYDAGLAGAQGELRDPGTLDDDVRLDQNGELQCTSCHDPHDNQFGMFLVKDNQASALCTTCHIPAGWESSWHETSSATWNGQGLDPWPGAEGTTVAQNACASCHTPHHAGTSPRLMNLAGEEPNCFVCHNGNVAEQDIEIEFTKFSVHDLTRTPPGVHDPEEDLVDSPRHVECSDCHDPHAAAVVNSAAPNLSGALAGVAGISALGTVVDPIQYEYELCFRCHADSVDRGEALVNRLTPQTNTRLEFDPGNLSFHPVVGPGANPDVPSLVAPYTESSRITCGDCHNNDQGPGADGSGPRGPHGSIFPPILERRLELVDGFKDGPGTYALCYKCHSRDYFLNNEPSELHKKHLEKNTSCVTCHDPHGMASTPYLINFNPDRVHPRMGVIEFVDEGPGSGNCTLTCHGEQHEAEHYGP